jgi:hypothetical protein
MSKPTTPEPTSGSKEASPGLPANGVPKEQSTTPHGSPAKTTTSATTNEISEQVPLDTGRHGSTNQSVSPAETASTPERTPSRVGSCNNCEVRADQDETALQSVEIPFTASKAVRQSQNAIPDATSTAQTGSGRHHRPRDYRSPSPSVSPSRAQYENERCRHESGRLCSFCFSHRDSTCT